MGIALALEAAKLGADVILVLGPTPGPAPRKRKNLRVFRVVSAREMDERVQAHLPETRVFVGAAAVADFRPAVTLRQKIKGKPARVKLDLVVNPDIIAKVARRGPHRPSVVIGFALESSGFALYVAALALAPLTLVQDGKSTYSIVISTDASPSEKHGAQELQKFLEEMWKWMDHYRPRIERQLRMLGCSLDWSRPNFTMEPSKQRAVRTHFIRLHKKGHLYRGDRIVRSRR